MNEKLSITMSGENCITKYMLSFVKKKKKKKYMVCIKKAQILHTKPNGTLESRMGKGEGQGDFSFSLYIQF